ncbi:MAG: GtrA family protein [Clostridia bacterium]|nr:GtrA family protein [Clostridia bacterium]
MLKKILNKETVLYLIFGGLTTLVNYVSFFLLYNVSQVESTLSNIIAFILAVVFAYFVNKLFVFESKSWAPKVIGPEILQFLSARIFSFVIEAAGLFVADKLLKLGRFTLLTVRGIELDGVLITKLALAVIVVILNYIFCKLVIFKKK